MLALSVPYEENSLNPYTLKNLKIIRKTLSSVFADVAIAPAENFHFFASESALFALKEQFLRTLSTDKIYPKYLNSGYIKYYFSDERMKHFASLTDDTSAVNSNHLFSFEIYSNNLMKWLLNNLDRGWIVIAALGFICIYFLKRHYKSLKDRFFLSGRSVSMFLSGFGAIAGEIMLLGFYQAVSGSLYYMYGIITALFMLGISCGGYIGHGLKAKAEKLLTLSFILLLIWLIGIEAMFFAASNGNIIKIIPLSAMLFLWNILGGFAMGLMFNSFALIREEAGVSGENAVSELYSYDLAGSAAGALLTGPLFLPLFGHTITMALMCVLVLAGWYYARK